MGFANQLARKLLQFRRYEPESLKGLSLSRNDYGTTLVWRAYFAGCAPGAAVGAAPRAGGATRLLYFQKWRPNAMPIQTTAYRTSLSSPA
ncbi:hypothetical protein [Paenibacillus sp. PAMC21692]|uniref:hypothetical protein n=1 Tax=Paenibacillus sp. PAMC21692 TaxID=2762320 RepID=UPI00164D75BE|nr:hypothetical protein [Paenibacillus sp. PAMC21692]QNK55912.1 hypothetical protein H7F31_25470 [Paenibacillus sp. PAMC21692]